MASTASYTSKLDKPMSVIWGCELNEQKKTFEFKIEDDESDKYVHQLALRTVCLGDKAKDEFHIVEIVSQEMGAEKTIPIATLKPSILPMAAMVSIDLAPPVTFRLKAGSGPVYLSGQHVSVEEEDSWAEDEDDGEAEGEEEEEEEEDPESPPKAVKRPAATKKAGQAKKKKLDKEDESSEEDSPTKKGKGAGRGRKPAAKK